MSAYDPLQTLQWSLRCGLMVRFLSLTALFLGGCSSTAPAPSQVEIIGSGSASDLSLIATSSRPFWQVVIDRQVIRASGLASPTGAGTIEFPLVPPAVQRETKTWTVGGATQPLIIEASRTACVRSDGFRFPVTVHLTIGDRQLTGCGQEGRDL